MSLHIEDRNRTGSKLVRMLPYTVTHSDISYMLAITQLQDHTLLYRESGKNKAGPPRP